MLVMVMVFNSIPYQPVSANDINNAIGIFNNVMTSQSGLTSDFKITFYKLRADLVPGTADDPQYTYTYVPVTLADEFQLEDTDGNIVYLEKDGKIRLEQGHSVLFNSDSNIALKNYLISHDARTAKAAKGMDGLLELNGTINRILGAIHDPEVKKAFLKVKEAVEYGSKTNLSTDRIDGMKTALEAVRLAIASDDTKENILNRIHAAESLWKSGT